MVILTDNKTTTQQSFCRCCCSSRGRGALSSSLCQYTIKPTIKRESDPASVTLNGEIFPDVERINKKQHQTHCSSCIDHRSRNWPFSLPSSASHVNKLNRKGTGFLLGSACRLGSKVPARARFGKSGPQAEASAENSSQFVWGCSLPASPAPTCA